MLELRHSEEPRAATVDPALERAYVELMRVDRLPPAPEIAMAALAYLEREDCNLADLAAFISGDQAIATGVLRLANSASFGLCARVGTIPQAVTRLGFSRVKHLVLGLSVWHSFGHLRCSPARYRLWAHSALVSGTARVLAQRMGFDGTEAFTGGLIHDVGKLVLGIRFGQEYWDLLVDVDDDAELWHVEQERFGCHHGTVGGWLLHLWHVPTPLVEMVTLHHEPLAMHDVCRAAVIALADRLVDATDPRTGTADPAVFAALDHLHPALLSAEEWSALYANIVGDQESIAELLD